MNPFTLLGLAETATPAEVRTAYRAKLHEVHPDVAGTSGHRATIDVIAAYQQALAIANARPVTVEPAHEAPFVPAQYDARGRHLVSTDSPAFVASTFHSVA